jgi:hypothetical protein
MSRRHALAGLDEPVRLGGVRRHANVVIDTGYELAPIGPQSDYTMPDDFELGDDGEAELHVLDGRTKVASATIRIVDGVVACRILNDFKVMSMNDCDYDQYMVGVEYVRVDPAHRGAGYSIALIEAAVKGFARRGWWVYADVYSQRIYANLRSVLGQPRAVVAGDTHIRVPSDEQVFALLDPLPIEGDSPYRGYGFRLGNKRNALVLWKV